MEEWRPNFTEEREGFGRGKHFSKNDPGEKEVKAESENQQSPWGMLHPKSGTKITE